MKEIWKDVPGYEGSYQVSNQGRVKSLVTYGNGGNGRILAGDTTRLGYVRIAFLGKRKLVHRVVYTTFCGKIPQGLEVNHKNGNKADNRLENLELLTKSENIKHSYRKLKNGHRLKVSPGKVQEIRQLCQTTNLTQGQIAERYGISPSYVSMLKNRQRRKP